MDQTAKSKKKIVIVEDNSSLAEIYKVRMEALGYQCYIAYNGVIGLYFIQKELPDLVLLDLMVPDISGGDILRVMRNGSWGKNTKVLVISNLNEEEAPQDLRQLGIEDYLVKANLSDDMLDQAVNKALNPQPQITLDGPTGELAVHDAPPADSEN